MADTRKFDVTNNDQGPRYLWAQGGIGAPVVVQPGETVTVELDQGQYDNAAAMMIDGTDDAEVFTFDEASHGGDEKPLARLPIAKLREIAAAEGVELTGRKDDQGADLPDLKKAGDIAKAIEAKRNA